MSLRQILTDIIRHLPQRPDVQHELQRQVDEHFDAIEADPGKEKARKEKTEV